MRPQPDIEIEIAVAAPVDAFAALARDTQTLPLGGALRNAHLHSVRHAPQQSLFVALRYLKIELEHRAVEGVLKPDVRLDLVVLAGNAQLALPRTGTAPGGE